MIKGHQREGNYFVKFALDYRLVLCIPERTAANKGFETNDFVLGLPHCVIID